MDEKAEKAEKITSLIAKIEKTFSEPTEEEKAKFTDKEPGLLKYYTERAYIKPPESDKYFMLCLNTSDPDLYKIFDSAAFAVTKKWGGFHQVGYGEKSGFTAWELWKEFDIPEEELLRRTKEKMIEIVNQGFYF